MDDNSSLASAGKTADKLSMDKYRLMYSFEHQFARSNYKSATAISVTDFEFSSEDLSYWLSGGTTDGIAKIIALAFNYSVNNSDSRKAITGVPYPIFMGDRHSFKLACYTTAVTAPTNQYDRLYDLIIKGGTVWAETSSVDGHIEIHCLLDVECPVLSQRDISQFAKIFLVSDSSSCFRVHVTSLLNGDIVTQDVDPISLTSIGIQKEGI